MIQKSKAHKKSFLLLSIISNLGVLFVFKYLVFFYNSLVTYGGFETDLLNQLIIPAGLSFYTFQSLSYTIDVYRGNYKPEDTLSDFFLYVSFFPHMVAGPIVRYYSLMPQLKVITYFKNIDWAGAGTLLIWGYFKKLVIADNLNLVVTPVFNNVTGFSGLELLTAGFLFVVQVYCDFSGYSDIATGIAKLFNIQLSLNWRRPLLSKSLQEFWQRNHISITTWFRDYLYIGLGGNRVSYKRWLLNIFLVFLISGLWHGANFTFVIWGAMHGVFYLGEVLVRKKFPTLKLPAFFGHLYLLSFHTISLIAFRANSVADLSYIYRHIFSLDAAYFKFSNIVPLQYKLLFVVFAMAILVMALKEINEEYAILNQKPKLYKFVKQAFYLCLVVLIFLAGNFSANTFIYFQF